jgi:hypothetical protein
MAVPHPAQGHQPARDKVNGIFVLSRDTIVMVMETTSPILKGMPQGALLRP